MVSIFETALAEEISAEGWKGYVRFCLGALADTLLVAVLERLKIRPGRSAGGEGVSLAPGLIRRSRGRLMSWASLSGKVDSVSGAVRFGLRSLHQTPLVSSVAVLTIALAVGLTAVTLGAVYSATMRPLPFTGGQRIMSVELVAQSGSPIQFEALELMDFRRRQTSFEELEGYFRRRVTIQDGDGPAQSLKAGVVTASMLEHLGTPPLLGRTFRDGEDFTASIQHVVLGFDVWWSRFGGRIDIVGSEVRIDGRLLEVIGVMPAGFRFPIDEDLWLPMDFDLPTEDRGSGRSFAVFGRLKEGVGIAQAQSEADVIARWIGLRNLDTHPPLTARVDPFIETHLPTGFSSMLRILVLAVGGILLIAGANVVNLLLARSVLRSRETGIRKALGAGRAVITFQFITESLLLSISGSAVGIGLAAGGMVWLDRATTRFSLPAWVQVRLDPPVLAVCVGVAVLFGVVAGLLAAWNGTTRPSEPMIGGVRGATHQVRERASRYLVTAQVAVSCALLIGAGLLVRSLIHARTLDLGYSADRVMTASVRLPNVDTTLDATRSDFFVTLLQRAASLPGVEGVAWARSSPGTGPTFSWDFWVEGVPPSVTGTRPSADGVPISHGYFDMMDIRLLQGRDFAENESRYGSQPVLIVNESLATRHLGATPVGSRLRLSDRPDEPWLTVVGVVEDSFIGSSSGGIGLAVSKREQIYISWGVAPYSSGTILMKSRGDDPLAMVPQTRALLAEVASSVSLDEIARLSSVIEDSTWAFGLFGSLFGVFGGVALILSVIGLYGVTAFAVSQRRQEMGVRMALGAAPGAILRLVFGTTIWQLGVGTTLGLILGYWLAQSIESVLFGVSAIDGSVYGATIVVLVITGAWAAFLSTCGVSRFDPADILDS